ncbi:hypothetical protein A145_04320 [Vibrio splendidus 5S-101]|jgi:hypothetical protein|uniref:FaeA/PapI family transcriptional regulator n=1 Tax=Vibrio splendidus TaxID=29497 RepID=UPI00038015BC|nr:FaeA/PapI family transcriptional regulator [Vibrio splendidus]OEF20938.1 hypothetical protein A145_04320 [Vibrio splendidus 5S-101]
MKVSNPLTIIAIFAGVAETLATVALVQLPLEIQSTFVYFVMAFPATIVLLFFFVLYYKNTVLYAPSDFDDQNHYLEANNLKEKVSNQLDSIFQSINERGSPIPQEELDKAKSSIVKTITREAMSETMHHVLNCVTKTPSNIIDIAITLNITRERARQLLKALEINGMVEQVQSAHGEGTLWKAST